MLHAISPDTTSLRASFSSPCLRLGWIRRFGAWVVENLLNDKIFANIFRSSRIKSMLEYMDEVEARNRYNAIFEQEVWWTLLWLWT